MRQELSWGYMRMVEDSNKGDKGLVANIIFLD